MASEKPRAEPYRRERYIVENMPPVWRRSLTESGMERRTTILDHVIVGVFVLICLAAGTLILLSQV